MHLFIFVRLLVLIVGSLCRLVNIKVFIAYMLKVDGSSPNKNGHWIWPCLSLIFLLRLFKMKLLSPDDALVKPFILAVKTLLVHLYQFCSKSTRTSVVVRHCVLTSQTSDWSCDVSVKPCAAQPVHLHCGPTWPFFSKHHQDPSADGGPSWKDADPDLRPDWWTVATTSCPSRRFSSVTQSRWSASSTGVQVLFPQHSDWASGLFRTEEQQNVLCPLPALCPKTILSQRNDRLDVWFVGWSAPTPVGSCFQSDQPINLQEHLRMIWRPCKHLTSVLRFIVKAATYVWFFFLSCFFGKEKMLTGCLDWRLCRFLKGKTLNEAILEESSYITECEKMMQWRLSERRLHLHHVDSLENSVSYLFSYSTSCAVQHVGTFVELNWNVWVRMQLYLVFYVLLLIATVPMKDTSFSTTGGFPGSNDKEDSCKWMNVRLSSIRPKGTLCRMCTRHQQYSELSSST